MRRLASVFTAIALPLALVACGSETAPAPETSTAAITARHALVAATLPDLKPVSGQITTRDEVMAVARIGGILTRLNVKAGDQVRAGQIVAVISDDRLSQAAGAASARRVIACVP